MVAYGSFGFPYMSGNCAIVEMYQSHVYYFKHSLAKRLFRHILYTNSKCNFALLSSVCIVSWKPYGKCFVIVTFFKEVIDSHL